jgi:transmembrane 9 superfamily protein 3
MMVVFLIGLVIVILLRTLRHDFARYDREQELGDLVRFYILTISSIEAVGS